MFFPLPGQTREEILGQDTREFLGDGTPYLYIPGLVSLAGVRIGAMEIPLSQTRKVPINATMELRSETVPMVQVVPGAAGVPILMRSTDSNHGIWQSGARIFVRGEWADEAAAKSDEKAAEKPADSPAEVKGEKAGK